MRHDIPVIIPARGNSKRVPGKNMRDFCGKPLVQWTIEMAQAFSTLVILTSENDNVLALGKELGVETIKRQDIFSADEVHASLAAHDAYVNYGLDERNIMVLLPTSPLRLRDDLEGANAVFNDPALAPSSVTGVYVGAPANRHRKVTPNGSLEFLPYNFSPLGQSQSEPPFYVVNGAVFITEARTMPVYGFHKPASHAWIMPRWRSIDIDTEADFLVAEAVFRGLG